MIKGAFSLIFLSEKYMCAIRDPQGFRPLSLGALKDGGYAVASETCAFDLINATYIRDVKPGEMLIFEDGVDEPKSIQVLKEKKHHCIFEYIYFARPDSNIYGKNVYSVRKQMGVELAKQSMVEADMVVAVPDSGVPAALGYSQQSKIPFELGIIRSHYVGRTFIEPTQDIRDLKVKMKLNPIKSIIEGKRLIVVDDSIVRGTTSRQIVRMLREAGAKEIHMRISSPPTKNPCYYGIDTPDKSELIASHMSVEDICKYIDADSLDYISLNSLNKSVHNEDNYCKACFDGNYIV